MATTDAMTRLILGTDDVLSWRPRRDTERGFVVGAWIIALVAGASECASEDEAELRCDLACAALDDRSGNDIPSHVCDTLRRELTAMGQSDRMARWSAILRGDVRPTEREAEALEQWTGEPTDLNEWES